MYLYTYIHELPCHFGMSLKHRSHYLRSSVTYVLSLLICTYYMTCPAGTRRRAPNAGARQPAPCPYAHKKPYGGDL